MTDYGKAPSWVGYLLWLLALASLAYAGAAGAEEPAHWTDWIPQTQVTSYHRTVLGGLGPGVETYQAAGLDDGTSICRAVGTHTYIGVWHQGATWVAFTTLEEE